jgi:benzoate membrane transport protein
MKFNDWQFAAVAAGFVAVLVGFASSVAIVLQAAAAAGASQAQAASWISILGFAMGITCIGFSYVWKTPILTAWSTPGAALLATSLAGYSLAEAIGVFMFSALLTVVLGLSGWFDRLAKHLPLPLASAMLAGILLQFGFAIFKELPSEPWLIAVMLLVFVLAKILLPRYTVPLVLLVSIVWCFGAGRLDFQAVEFAVVAPLWTTPEFNWQAMLGVGLPLFLVTMSSQNIPGLAVLRTSGYAVPVSPLLSWTGFITLVTAPFGNFSVNLAAITAAICAGPEAHPDPNRRYTAGIAAGVFYLATGIAGATVVALFAAFPKVLVAVLAGVALLTTIASNLQQATQDGPYRDAAMLTLLMTASGVSFLGLASAFWGLLLGVSVMAIQGWLRGKN